MAQKNQDGGGQGKGGAPKGSDAAARLQAERAAHKAGEAHRNDMHARKEAMAARRQNVAAALARIERREKESAVKGDQPEEKGTRWWSWLRGGKSAGDKQAEKKPPAGAVRTHNLTMPDSEANPTGSERIAIDADTASPPRHGAGNSPTQSAPTHPKPRVAAEPDPAINPMEELREQDLLDKCRFELAHGEPGKAILVVTLRGEVTPMDRDDIINELKPYEVVDEKQRLVIEGDDTIARVASDLLKAKKGLHHAKGFEMPESLAKALRGHGIKWTQRAAGESAHGQAPQGPTP